MKEQTGLQVSNFYIAQVKRKFGIIERVIYNLLKSEKLKAATMLAREREGYYGGADVL